MIAKDPAQAHPQFAEYQRYSPGPDAEYQSRLKGRRALREAVIALMDRFALDALVFPHKTVGARRLGGGGNRASDAVEVEDDRIDAVVRSGDRVTESDNYLSSMTGLPGLVVPMGYSSDGLPLALEFLGRPFAEPTVLRLGSGFEAQTKHRKAPASVPPLPGETFEY
jgi:amidase